MPNKCLQTPTRGNTFGARFDARDMKSLTRSFVAGLGIIGTLPNDSVLVLLTAFLLELINITKA
jgi:hypothetical protein